MNEENERIDWNKVRIDAAIGAMQALVGNPNIKQISNKETVMICVKIADDIVAELQKTKP